MLMKYQVRITNLLELLANNPILQSQRQSRGYGCGSEGLVFRMRFLQVALEPI